jgi:enediyne biosynthesis protein E4
LYKSVNGSFVPDSVNDRLLRDVGLVSAAEFTDLNGDGWPDLVLAIEWNEIRVFINDHGRFTATVFPGLSGVTSRWNGIATGDLDNDGRLDIVATSWGRNTDYSVGPDDPLYLYWGFFSGSGRPEFLLARRDPRLKGIAPVESFDRLAAAFPGLPRRIPGFTAYADATIDRVIGSRRAEAVLTATTLDNMAFLNRGDHFEARVLPPDAQFAPAFYAGVADFDGDGNEDVFLSQNFFATAVPTPRFDAGRSLLLRGDGTGGLQPVDGEQSGLMVYGEQRGAAYADYDGDGRVDLVVSENGAATKLFHNVGAKPGLRVRVAGPPGNPTGIGTQLRLRYGEAAGPVREIQAGSGYWSQNGGVQVLGRRGEPTGLWIRWPGGREQVVPLTVGQREITIRPPK